MTLLAALATTIALAAPGASLELCVSSDIDVPRQPPAVMDSVDRARAYFAYDQLPPRELLNKTDFLDYVPPPALEPETLGVAMHAMPHPLDPSRVFVSVDAVAHQRHIPRTLPETYALVVDTSKSMGSVPTRALPLLQDERPAPTPPFHSPVSRLELSILALHDFVDTLVPHAMVSIAAVDQRHGVAVLPPTPARDRRRIHWALDQLRPGMVRRDRPALDIIDDVVREGRVECADNRMILVTDDHAFLHPDTGLAEQAFAEWATEGFEVWSVSVGLLGAEAEGADKLADMGIGGSLRADTRSEFAATLAHPFADMATVVRKPVIRVAFDDVSAWRRAGDDAAWRGPDDVDEWTTPSRLPSGWTRGALYEVVPSGPDFATTTSWSASSPIPGDWSTEGQMVVGHADIPASAREAASVVRDRAFASLFVDGLGRTDRAPGRHWSALEFAARHAMHTQGIGREVHTWISLAAWRAEVSRVGSRESQ